MTLNKTIERLNGVADHIEKTGRVYMGNWFSIETNCVTRESKIYNPKITCMKNMSDESFNKVLSHECDTVGCIAGITIALYKDENSYKYCSIWARKLLGLDESQALKLFFQEKWIKNYKKNIHHTYGDEANMVVDYIRNHYIPWLKNGGNHYE